MKMKSKLDVLNQIDVKRVKKISSQISKFAYTPLKKNLNLKLLSLATLDIETFEDKDSLEQIPLIANSIEFLIVSFKARINFSINVNILRVIRSIRRKRRTINVILKHNERYVR